MAQRRELSFPDFDAIERDLALLQAHGYDKAGNWDLAQVCGHLTEWMRFPLDGYPRPGFFVRGMLWMMKVTVGKGMKRKILTTGKMPAGGPTIKETVPAPGGDATAAVAKVKEMMQRFQAHAGEYHSSPLFGFMTRDEHRRLQLVHGAHHLSFLVTKTN